jgi:predicted DCC family thiol-disulfide oxidoreductase YuxK
VTASADARRNVLFYDATCGVCCASARFAAWVARDGALEVAALGSAVSQQLLTERERASAPDSVLVKTADQRLLARSDALIFTLRQLGWPWSALSWVARLVPRNLRDRAYDAFAHRRPHHSARA